MLLAVLCLLLVGTLIPLVWVTLGSFKTNAEIFGNTFGLPEVWQFENYQRAWTEGNFGRYFFNSLVIAAAATVLSAVVACPAGYQFARSRSRGINALFYLYLFGMTLPLQAVIIPAFYQLRYYGLIDTQAGLALLLVGTGTPFASFLMRNFFRDLPGEILEAAEVDGAGPWQVVLRVALPLAKPGVQALAVFVFLVAWNEYLLALLVLLSEGTRTIPLGLVRFQQMHSADYGALFAGIVMAMIPSIAVYVLLQRSFTRGISAGAQKG